MHNSKKGYNSATTSPTEEKKIWVRLFFMLVLYIEFQNPIDRMQALQTDGQAQTNMHPQLFQH